MTISRLIAITFSGLACLLSLPGCQQATPPASDSGTAAPPEASIQLATAELKLVERRVRIPFTLEGYQQIDVTSRIDGHLLAVHFDIGDQVAAGDLLAELYVPELGVDIERQQQVIVEAERAIESRRAEQQQAVAHLAEQNPLLELRGRELRRISNLVEAGALTKEKQDEAEFSLAAVEATRVRIGAEIDTAGARVRRAEAQLAVEQVELRRREVLASYTRIEAPFDGSITARHVHPGSYVEPAGGESTTALYELESTDRLRIVMFLPLADASSLETGQDVTIISMQGQSTPPTPDPPLAITRTSQAFQRGSRMMRAEADLDNPDGLVRPGDYGVAEIVLERFEDKPVIPVAALVPRRSADGTVEGYFVMQVDESQQVWRSDVKVLFQDNNVAVIGDGLEAGDQVITANQDRFQDRQKLTPGQLDSSYR
jgi:HlyD family secretion protein